MWNVDCLLNLKYLLQEVLNRAGTEIYVNFSSKFKEIRMPDPGTTFDDGMTRDYTGQFPANNKRYKRPRIHKTSFLKT